MITVIAAVDRDCGISCGQIPWRLQDDQMYFASVTKGAILIMGRVTYESMVAAGVKFGDRYVIVLSRRYGRAYFDAKSMPSLAEALEFCSAAYPGREVFICGGREVFRQGMDLADRLILTRVWAEYDCDLEFNPWECNWMHQSHRHDVASFRRYERNSDPFEITIYNRA
jgi:dihydrofolate reductase